MDEKKQRQRILVGTALAFLLFIDLLPYLWHPMTLSPTLCFPDS